MPEVEEHGKGVNIHLELHEVVSVAVLDQTVPNKWPVSSGFLPIESVSCSVSNRRCDRSITEVMLPKSPSKSTFFTCRRVRHEI